MTAARARIADIARRYVDCGDHLDVERYLDVVQRPADRNPTGRRYMTGHPSTCALFVLGVWRLFGLEEPETVEPYVRLDAHGGLAGLRVATADMQTAAGRRGAWQAPRAGLVPQCGDGILIDDGTGVHAHAICCVSDARPLADGSWEIDTVEGGQAPDSSYIRAFTRRLVTARGRLWMGSRYVLGWADADRLLPAMPFDGGPTLLEAEARAANGEAAILVGMSAHERPTLPDVSG